MMKGRLLFLVVLIPIFFMSCKKNEVLIDDEFKLLENQKLIVDGVEREYHMLIPPHSVNKPLVVLLHGHGGDFDQSIGNKASKAPQKIWLQVAQENDFIVVVPNGVIGPDDSRGWNDCRSDAIGNPDIDDVGFISQLLDQIQEEYRFDNKRVYIAGVSNGASMSIRLAHEIPEKIAAFASIITTMPANSECTTSEIPISALFMNGTDDPIAPYDGGEIASNRGLVLSTDKSIDYWINRNNTDAVPITEFVNDNDENDKSIIEKYTYGNGDDNTEVVLYKVIGGGHTEPSILERYSNLYLAITGEQNGDLEMAEEVWKFFKTKSK